VGVRYERWKAAIPALSDHPLKVAFARCELCEQPPDELAAALDALCREVDDAVEMARDILSAFVPVLIDPEHLEPIQAVRHAARDASLPAAARLLRCSSRQGHLFDKPALPPNDQRTLTLGERRALARKPSRAMLAKLFHDPHPMVAQILLENPRITEGDVITMAARRPAIPSILLEIGKRWSRRPRVRMALALNPAAPPALVVPLLGLLVRPELAEVARAADLLPVVRVTAKELWDLRPPLRPVPVPDLRN
jgi:hypothetical protein